MVVVFLPFGWFILRMLRFTDETVGEHSPMHLERTYHFTASHYFGSFLRIANPILVVMMFASAFMMSKGAIRQEEPLLFIFSLFFLGFAGFLCFVIYFDWQYWAITKNVFITFSPFQPGLIVDTPTQHYVLTPDTVEHIEQHENDPKYVSKMLVGYGYYLFYTADGQVVRINNIFFSNIGHIEFMERFFSTTPKTVVWHRLLWVTNLNGTEKPEQPNFAAQNQR